MLSDFKIRNVIIYYTLTIITLNKMFSGGDLTLRLYNAAEHEIFLAHKCLNVNHLWHFNIYEQEKLYNSIIDL